MPKPLPSPTPSASDGADETLPTIPTLLSPSLPESVTPRKRTAQDARLGDERPEMGYKRARSEDRAPTRVSGGAGEYLLTLPQTQPLSSPPPEITASKKRTAGDSNLDDWRAEVGLKKARIEDRITPPASQPCSKALSGQNIISTANDTPKRTRFLTRKPQLSSDRKAQGLSKKDSWSFMDKRANKEDFVKTNVRNSPREERRKRRLKRVEEPGQEQEHIKGKLEIARDTPRKSKLVANMEKQLYPRKGPVGITKRKKDTRSPPAKIRLRNAYIEEDTTETDDSINLKRSWPRRDRVNHRVQEPDTKTEGSVSQDIVAPATPESCPDFESGPTFVRRDTVIGLRNLGFTCYNNAIVQALCNTPGFREYLLQNKFSWSKKDKSSNHTRKSVATAPVRRTRQSTRIAVEKEKIPPPPDM